MADNNVKPQEEIWKPVVGYEEIYAVSSWGRVMRTKGYKRPDNRILKNCIHSKKVKYFIVTLSKNGKHKNELVHRLVNLAFKGPQPSPNHDVAHGDGNQHNNHHTNLRWATPLENSSEMVKHNKSQRGTKNNKNVLKEKDVLEIRKLSLTGNISQRAIADMFNVDPKTVHNIKYLKQWHWLNEDNLTSSCEIS